MITQNLFQTWLALTAIISIRYVLIAGLFYFLLWHRPDHKIRAIRLASQKPTRAIMKHEITMSLISSFIYAIPGALIIEAMKAGGTKIYSGPITPSLDWIYVPISIFLYLFVHDTYFYWSHRAMHTKKLFNRTHLTHHRSRHPTPWAAFSFHPWEAILSAWPLPLLTLFIPIHVGAVFFLLIFMTYCSVANHAGWEIIPRTWLAGRFGKIFISASHHHLHHTDYKANFGLYFRFWDKLIGTDKGIVS